MKEFLYHALGICGEHWHPNLINITLIIALTSIAGRFTYKRIKTRK